MAGINYRVPFPFEELNYEESVQALHDTLKFGICPLLETVQDMLAELDDPDLRYTCVQVAGTNGKTSTARYVAAILAGEGRSVALYTSPELVSYTERMEVGGRPVSEDAFAHGISAAVEAGRRVNARRAERGDRPYDVTEFDLLTVAACVVFAEAGVDTAVLEVGMGGRWDATSAVKSITSVGVTGIGLDHTRILGDTLEAIAAEKAAVIQSERTCVLGPGVALPESVEDVFLDRAREQGVTPTLVRALHAEDVAGITREGEPRVHGALPLVTFEITAHPNRLGAPLQVAVNTTRAAYEVGALKPSYQAANITCAIALAEAYLGRALDQDRLFESVVGCPTPGRFDVVRPDPLGLVDACHNPQSVEVFLTAVRAIERDVAKRPTLLCAVLSDKDVDGIVGLLAGEFPSVVVTQTSSPRALVAEELAERFLAKGARVAGAYPTVAEAVAALADEPFVACGSITTAGEVTGLLRWRTT